jgi:hypothetical protein
MGKIKVICDTCGVEFEKYESKIGKKLVKYVVKYLKVVNIMLIGFVLENVIMCFII